jgi:hypothetical protein
MDANERMLNYASRDVAALGGNDANGANGENVFMPVNATQWSVMRLFLRSTYIQHVLPVRLPR